MPGPIRTALKVDLQKAAAEQPYLHVSEFEIPLLCNMLIATIESVASRQCVGTILPTTDLD